VLLGGRCDGRCSGAGEATASERPEARRTVRALTAASRRERAIRALAAEMPGGAARRTTPAAG